MSIVGGIAPVGSDGRRATGIPWVAAASIAAATAADVAFDPAHRHLPLCPFHAATGWWCPLCGGLRAAAALARGHLATAVHYNVVFVAALPAVAIYWLDWLLRSRRGLTARALNRPALITLVAVGVAFTVIRNLPFAAPLRP
jgi:hypothetical protein